MEKHKRKQEPEESRREPLQAEGPDEEAGEGLEQQAQQAAPLEGEKRRCRADKGGVVH